MKITRRQLRQMIKEARDDIRIIPDFDGSEGGIPEIIPGGEEANIKLQALTNTSRVAAGKALEELGNQITNYVYKILKLGSDYIERRSRVRALIFSRLEKLVNANPGITALEYAAVFSEMIKSGQLDAVVKRVGGEYIGQPLKQSEKDVVKCINGIFDAIDLRMKYINEAKMKITRRQLRKIIAEATQMSSMRRYDEQSEYLAQLAHGLVVGAEQIFGIDLSEADEYEYSQDFRAILEKNPDMLELLGEIYKEIRFGNREDETSAPPLTRSELLDIAVKRMDMVGFGELTEEDFEAVKEELLEDGMDPDLVNQLTYDEVLQRISDIENVGMDR